MTTIRTAGPDDAATILAFIHALAVYEREPDAVEATEASLRAQLAADHPPFHCLVASVPGEDGNRDVGMALWFPTYSTWTGTPGIHLEDLFVEPDARGSGVGLALLTALADEVVARGWGRLEWAVLDWNQPAIDFYDRIGAAPLSEWTTWRLAGDDLHALATRT
ncbi:GNAT family N-acetyltransferase [Salsipaludibacter albus]|uniref:GNAT family N-acetyltransferase n=1 Tax=Salsipaludibacter albus TaxID=2849650 RepID=UPI001EE41C55|nr:GNAT family N-acetyltransferase [Salsipaludibacter albus]MBY5162273.1 GNAT family N-acetyltransferase [Salsipaludibacter albus]